MGNFTFFQMFENPRRGQPAQQSRYCAKVRAEAKKRLFIFFLLLSTFQTNFARKRLLRRLRRGKQARNFTTTGPKILDLKSFSEQIFSRKLSLGAPDLIHKHLSNTYFCFEPFIKCIWLQRTEVISFNHDVQTSLNSSTKSSWICF